MMRHVWVFFAMCAMMWPCRNAFAIVFYLDGLTHLINQPSDAIFVDNGNPPDFTLTRVTIVPGGIIQTVPPGFDFGAANVFNTSVIELAGGSIMTNSEAGHGIVGSGEVLVKVTSGTISTLGFNSTGIQIAGEGHAEVFGGTINAFTGIDASVGATVTIHGGTIRGTYLAFHLASFSKLYAYGGLLGDMDGFTDLSIAGGEAHFYGHSFQLDGVPVGSGLIAGPADRLGRLTGVLANGDPLDLGIHVQNLVVQDPALVFVHVVPEPSAVSAVSCAVLCLAIGRRQRRGELISNTQLPPV